MHKASGDPDEILDAALATYADPAERVDPSMIAARILLTARETREGRRWWLWGLASIPAVAVLLMIVLSVRPAEAPKPSAPSQALQASRIPLQQGSAVIYAKTHIRHVARADVSRHSIPKLEQFPSPQPLSEQERLMVELVNRTSPATRQAVARSTEISEPIKIAALKVPPIDQISKEIKTLGEHNEERH